MRSQGYGPFLRPVFLTLITPRSEWPYLALYLTHHWIESSIILVALRRIEWYIYHADHIELRYRHYVTQDLSGLVARQRRQRSTSG
jgi:hypothetical protein